MIRTREHPRRFWSCCSSPRQEVRVPAEFLKAADITEPDRLSAFDGFFHVTSRSAEPRGSRQGRGGQLGGAAAAHERDPRGEQPPVAGDMLNKPVTYFRSGTREMIFMRCLPSPLHRDIAPEPRLSRSREPNRISQQQQK